MWNFQYLAGLVLFVTFRSIHGASKYYTGDIRPYEFGFNLEGNQHRHEMKDARGIIMGEFGFITADGVYHVTVYATDEDGNFKVTSRKNIRLMKIEPPNAILPKINMPTSMSPFMIKLTSQTAQQYSTQSTFQETTTEILRKDTTTKPNQFVTGCSGCKIPDFVMHTSTITPLPPPPFKVFTTTTTTATLPQKLIESKQDATAPTSEQFDNSNVLKSLSGNNKLDSTTTTQTYETRKQNNLINDLLDVRTPDTEMDITLKISQPQKPKLGDHSNVYKEDQPIVNRYSNMQGAMKEIINGLLYQFNYDVGYHGHREEGDRRGAKKGEYYTVGRDGVKRIVSYEANEFGYQPNSKSVQARRQEIPQIDTEREAGLKGYEFKWFYA